MKDDIEYMIAYFEQRYNRREQRRYNILIFASTLLILLIVIGIIGYMSIFSLEFTEAVYNTVLVLTSIDTPTPAITSAQKVFIIIFAFISTILLLSVIIAAIDAIIDGYIDY